MRSVAMTLMSRLVEIYMFDINSCSMDKIAREESDGGSSS